MLTSCKLTVDELGTLNKMMSETGVPHIVIRPGRASSGGFTPPEDGW